MINQTNKNNQSQLERANAILIGLRPEITPQDKVEAQKELNLSDPTMSRYLNGQAKKIMVALDLIQFFKGKIAEREKKLQGAA